MAVTRTFSIIKPDATRRNLTGAVTKMLEDAGLRVVASKRIHMTRDQAEGFYAVHKERPFFSDLCHFMISGPVVVQVLEGEDAVQAQPRRDGRDQPGGCRAGHDPQGTGRIDRGQFGPWFGQRRECRDRDRLLLQPTTKSSAKILDRTRKWRPSEQSGGRCREGRAALTVLSSLKSPGERPFCWSGPAKSEGAIDDGKQPSQPSHKRPGVGQRFQPRLACSRR